MKTLALSTGAVGTLYRTMARAYHVAWRQPTTLAGTIRGNGVRAYWFTAVVNFGDLITPLLLRHYGFTPILARVQDAEVVAAGSVLETMSQGYSGYIAGAGLVSDCRREFAEAKVLAVRGKLTRQRIGAAGTVALGDPGLLVSDLLRARSTKQYRVGIVPHYTDRSDYRVRSIQKRYPDDVLVIDVMRRPLDVAADIDRCEAILSSSLHGIVTADALGIPRKWIQLSGAVAGGGFKFADYFSALDERQIPGELAGSESLTHLARSTFRPGSGRVERATDVLRAVFSGLADRLRER